MQCEHNLDKATLLLLVLQVSDIVTCICQVIESVNLEVLLYEEYRLFMQGLKSVFICVFLMFYLCVALRHLMQYSHYHLVTSRRRT